jgi:hypothetical protein
MGPRRSHQTIWMRRAKLGASREQRLPPWTATSSRACLCTASHCLNAIMYRIPVSWRGRLYDSRSRRDQLKHRALRPISRACSVLWQTRGGRRRLLPAAR